LTSENLKHSGYSIVIENMRLGSSLQLYLGWEAFSAGDINGPPTFPKRGNNPPARRREWHGHQLLTKLKALAFPYSTG
jgi:hypothetical protein